MNLEDELSKRDVLIEVHSNAKFKIQNDDMKWQRWTLSHIPGHCQNSVTSSTVEVIASKIEARMASKIIGKLSTISPLPGLGHVKRICKRKKEEEAELYIILCLDGECPQTDRIVLSDMLMEVVNEYGLAPFKTKVPRQPASSKDEWIEQCRLWPTAFHPNSLRPEQMEFSMDEKRTIFKYMELAIKEACLARKLGQPANGAVIVDPVNGCIIAAGHDQSSGCITSKLIERASSKECVGYLIRPLRHALMVAIEKAAERDVDLFPDAKEQKINLELITVKRRRLEISATETNNLDQHDLAQYNGGQTRHLDVPRPYLCTGFDVYVTREPCVMCAMALVHQRVRRVIFGIRNLLYGALGSTCNLHGVSGLNHRYEVFHISMVEDDLQRDLDIS